MIKPISKTIVLTVILVINILVIFLMSLLVYEAFHTEDLHGLMLGVTTVAALMVILIVSLFTAWFSIDTYQSYLHYRNKIKK